MRHDAGKLFCCPGHGALECEPSAIAVVRGPHVRQRRLWRLLKAEGAFPIDSLASALVVVDVGPEDLAKDLHRFSPLRGVAALRESNPAVSSAAVAVPVSKVAIWTLHVMKRAHELLGIRLQLWIEHNFVVETFYVVEALRLFEGCAHC